MSKLTVYQKPTCSTCRTVVREMKEAGEEFESVNYYEQPFDTKGLKALCKNMGIAPRELLRTKELLYKELHLATRTLTDDELIALMIEHPDLIQRPIIVKGQQAILARPVERWKELFE